MIATTIPAFGECPSAFGVAKDATGSYDLGLAVVAVCVTTGALILNQIRRKSASRAPA